MHPTERRTSRLRSRASPVRIVLAIIVTSYGCDSATAPQHGIGAPPGPDTGEPFPIDRGDAGGHTPESYKGLLLRLTFRTEAS